MGVDDFDDIVKREGTDVYWSSKMLWEYSYILWWMKHSDVYLIEPICSQNSLKQFKQISESKRLG